MRYLAALLALAAVGCEAIDDPAGDGQCGVDGVFVADDGESYCLHHDVPSWRCPAGLPIRTAYRGVAICGAEAPAAERIHPIAEAGMYTSRLYAQVSIVAVEPDAPRPFELPADAPPRVAVDIEHSASAGWSYDGAPSYCLAYFSHFEVHRVDGALELTAWARQDCAPDNIIHGAMIQERHPAELGPLPLGEHRLRYDPVADGPPRELTIFVQVPPRDLPPVVHPEPCGDDGVLIDDHDRRYCLLPDVPSRRNPPGFSRQASYRGVAIYGPQPLAEDRVRAIAEAGMYTSRLPARIVINAIAPGTPRPLTAPAGARATFEAEVEYDPSASWSYDGAASYCRAGFSHIEAHRDGDTIAISAWADLDCSPDHTITGLQTVITRPFTVDPLPAGDYRLAYDGGEIPLTIE